ncbi:MAG: DUF362 domain-containing protein, partial [Planctomycetota bacterium]
CIKWCSAEAIAIHQESAVIDDKKCLGCGYCLCVCPRNAIGFNWDAKPELIQERMVEHALGVVSDKRSKCIFLNFAQEVTEFCDCMQSSGKLLLKDAGVLVSDDPVAIDCASIDVVNEAAGKDTFKQSHAKINYRHQIDYAESLGLGVTQYELVEIN